MDRRWKVLAVVSVAVFMVSLDLFIVNVAFPDIERAFAGTDVATVSWVLNAYAIVLAAMMVPAGRLADRSGRRRTFLSGLVLFALASALCGAAGSVEMLIAARAIQALGAVLLLPTSLALLLPEFPPEQRPAAIGVWAAVGAVAAASGPPLGGLLVEASWRLVFYVNLPVAAAALAVAWGLLRESRDEGQQRPELPGAAVLIVSIGLLALGLVKAPDWGWGDGRTIAALALAVLGLVGFWIRCQRHPAPLVEPALLRVRSYALANTAALLFSASFAAMLLACVLFMTDVWGDSTLTAGLSLAPGPMMAAALAVTAGRLVNRVGQARMGAAGTALFALGCGWWLWQAGQAPAYASEMLPGLLITGAGVGLTLPSLTSAAAASLPPQRFATGSAVFTMSRQLGFALGVAILVAALGTPDAGDPVRSFDHGWLFMVIAAALASMSALAIGPLRPATPSEQGQAGPASAQPAAVQAGSS